MSWKFVFNGSNLLGKTLVQIARKAFDGGYEFFLFNGDVYFIQEGKIYKTKITVEDLF